MSAGISEKRWSCSSWGFIGFIKALEVQMRGRKEPDPSLRDAFEPGPGTKSRGHWGSVCVTQPPHTCRT